MVAARERLLAAATQLFYERGITASGVDTVASVSGVSKPTLYARFGTKEALVTAALVRQHELRRAALEEYLASRVGEDPRQRLLSVFDWVAEHQRAEWTRGCPFVNASVELSGPSHESARAVIRAHKQWFRSVVAELAALAGVHDPRGLASQMHLLLEGANARMLAEGDCAAIDEARSVAALIIDTQRRAMTR